MKNVLVATVSALTIGLSPVAMRAQGSPPPDLPLTPSDIRTIIAGAAPLVDSLYVDPKKGREIAVAIRRALSDTALTHIGGSLEFTRKFNQYLQSASGDAHLAVGYSFEPDTAPEEAPETPAQRQDRAIATARDGYGIARVERLDGNIGVLTLTSFHDVDVAGAAVGNALYLLAGTDALIIDLRNCLGGAPDMVQFLASYFFDAEPIHLSTSYLRTTNVTNEVWTIPWLPAPRYLNRDVFILTNRVTRSAAEGFTFLMQQRKRAVVVGQKSRGAAHMGRFFGINPHWAIYVPVGRVTEAVSGTDWEVRGVEPNVPTAAEDALKSAQLLALKGLLASTKSDDERLRLQGIVKKLAPPSP